MIVAQAGPDQAPLQFGVAILGDGADRCLDAHRCQHYIDRLKIGDMELVDEHVVAVLVEGRGSKRHREIDRLDDGRARLPAGNWLEDTEDDREN